MYVSTSNRRKKITTSIIDTFLSRLDELPSHKQRHFLWRASLISDRPQIKKELERLAEYTLSLEPTVEEYLSDPQARIKRGKEKLETYQPKKPNDYLKLKLWHKRPEVYYHHTVLWIYYYLVNLCGFSSDKWLKRWQQIAPSVSNYVIYSPRYIQHATSSAVNIIFLHYNLGIEDKRKEFLNSFQQAFSQEEPSEDIAFFTNYIYGLTHVVIGESDFYRYWPTKYEWIIGAFNQYEKDVEARLSLDVNTEVALCYLLSQEPNKKFVNSVIKRLEQHFDPQKGYIQREDEDSFEFAEHLNAVALVLLNFSVLEKKLRTRK